MITGSGLVDRDENHKRIAQSTCSASWRATLPKRGFDSLRYDKRGVGESEGDFWSAGLSRQRRRCRGGGGVRARCGRGDSARTRSSCWATVKAPTWPPWWRPGPPESGRRDPPGGRSPAWARRSCRWQAVQVAQGPHRVQCLLASSVLRIDVVKAQREAAGQDQAVHRGLVPRPVGGEGQRQVDARVLGLRPRRRSGPDHAALSWPSPAPRTSRWTPPTWSGWPPW